MVQVKCRRCGAAKELPDQHGPITVVCPVCRWRETYPARRPLPEKLAHDAGAAFKAHQQHEQLAASAIERLQGLSPIAFEQFCARLFEVQGHTVVPADVSRAQSHALELRDGNAVTYVACKRSLGQEAVSLEEVENLAGSMRHDGVASGIFVTTGSFAPKCRQAAEDAGIELIDGEMLHLRLDSVDLHALGL
ncbi:MAG: restriction endonuclease [Planctomycetota bacterium]|jgi:restriction endonuclease Mrr